MSDQHSFAAFTSSGAFTGDPKFSVPQAVAGLSDGLTLYVLTKALIGNKYQATYTPTNVIEPSALSDLCSHNKLWVCYRNDTLFGGVVARLTRTDHPGTGYLELMAMIYQKGWATPQSLFQNAFDCATRWEFGGSVVEQGADGALRFSCLSLMAECFSELGGAPRCNLNGRCPISVCPKPVGCC
jgi:hypothetical protein